MADRDKFKVWCTATSTWDKSDWGIDSDGKLSLGVCFANESKSKLVRCTGIKDKNGTLIYEGDWLRINCHSQYDGRVFKVGFEDGCFGFYAEESIEMVSFGKYKSDAFLAEVIYEEFGELFEIKGNIYSNPELDPTKETINGYCGFHDFNFIQLKGCPKCKEENK